MSTNKKLTVDELIKIANDSKREMHDKDISIDLNDASKFAMAFKIKKGKHKVLIDVIYRSYCIWAFKPISKMSFSIHFARMFEKYKGKYKVSYYINYQPGELLNEAERMRRNYE